MKGASPFDGRERSRVPDPKIPYLDSEGSDMGQRYLFLAAAVLQICIQPWLGRPTIEPAASCLEIYQIKYFLGLFTRQSTSMV